MKFPVSTTEMAEGGTADGQMAAEEASLALDSSGIIHRSCPGIVHDNNPFVEVCED